MGEGRQVGDLNALLPAEDGEDNVCMKKRKGDKVAISTPCHNSPAIERARIDRTDK
jgi:hypothetical protein